MSYLQLPRLNFAGRFQADPSTVNNDPEHFDTGNFQSSYDLLKKVNNQNGWWNPAGSGAWNFYNCTVQSVTYKDGTTCYDPSYDPIIGTSIHGADARVSGKIVDLDPDQQSVSQLWGFQVNLGDEKSGLGFKSDFKTAPFADLSFSRCPSLANGVSAASAFYQSVLELSAWSNTKKSKYLTEVSTGNRDDIRPEKLSIKFTVDEYNGDSSNAQFTYGRIAGSIGVYNEREPERFINGRVLVQANSTININTAYAIVQEKSLIIDLGNTFQITSIGGPFTDLGKLYAAIMDPITKLYSVIGEIHYLEEDWYFNTAGIVSIAMTEEQIALSLSNSLVIVQSPASQQPNVLLSESACGKFVRADDFVFRLNPGETGTAKFYATLFGKPYPNQVITLGYSCDPLTADTANLPNGTPQHAFKFPKSIITNDYGYAELEMVAGDPGNPRIYIDGQVYGITYALGITSPGYGVVINHSQLINVLVFNGFEIPHNPNWMEHIQPIFQQYANLYPVMKPIVDLSNFGSVVSKLFILKNVFSKDVEMTNPNYMPVTRDLSEAKREMIRRWLDNPIYMDLDESKDLTQALQLAIELEHSTIPPYLSALYSIKAGVNTEVSALIRSVVLEEMLHMSLVSNLLVSIGGKPRIGQSGFVPNYPSSLPGGLRQGLVVSLKKCSIEHIRECFMSIEEPENLTLERRKRLHGNNQSDVQKYTIGWFYNEIKTALINLSKAGKITFGHEENQVSQHSGTGDLFKILNLDDALKAINVIVEQGEGASAVNPDDAQVELAHYFKFGEIVAGKHYVKGKDGYDYTGAIIAFNPDGVWPMMDNPNNVSYESGSRAQILDNQFSATYKALLSGLHKTFNGEPKALREAIGSMFSLEVIGRKLMEEPSGLEDGTNAGPTFQTSGIYPSS